MSDCSPLSQGLYAFFHGGIAGKTICFLGDSTTSNATLPGGFFSRLAFLSQSGGPLEGVTCTNYGENGASCAAFLSNQVTHGITNAIAANADLYVFDYGINDVRLGAADQLTIRARILDSITKLRAGVPKSPIILRMPNPFLTTDPTSSGFVSPLSSSPVYTLMLRAIYRDLSDMFPNVLLLDTARTVYGETTVATSALMTDILHANIEGQWREADELVKLIGQAAPYLSGLSYNAKVASFTAPWAVYPRSLEDTRYYRRIFSGLVADSGSGYVRLSFTDAAIGYGDIKRGDILAPVGLAPFQSTQTASFRQSGNVLQVSMTSPVTLTQGVSIAVYRDLWQGDANIQEYISRTDTMPYRVRCYVSGAGVNLLQLTPYDIESQNLFRLLDVGDTLLVQGQSPVVIATSGGAIIPQFPNDPSATLGYISFSNGSVATGDKTALLGKPAYIFGTARRINQAPLIVPRFRAPGDVWADNSATFGLKTRAGTGSTYADYNLPLANFRILKSGTATLAAGTVAVAETSVTANSRILIARQSLNGSTAIADLTKGTVTVGTGFNIDSLKPDTTVETGDTSIVTWLLIEP